VIVPPRSAHIPLLAFTGALVAPLSAIFLPGFVIGQITVGVLSAACWWWSLRRTAQDRRHIYELGRARWYRMTVNQLIAAAPVGKLYLGTGAVLQVRHGQALHDLSATDRDAIPQDARTKGDNRIMGITWRDLRPFLIDEADANVHFLIYGATKRGKTRIAEILALQAILRERVPVIIIDPKGDPTFRARMQAAAKRAGAPFHCLDFAAAEHSATYNPIGAYTDPDQVGDQVAQLCDHGEGSSYWRGRAANTARIVARAMDVVRRYLEACGGSGTTPPPALAALERERGFQTLPAFFAPFGWHPRLSVLDLYGVTAAHRLLGWMLRIVYADRLAKEPDAPEFADRATISAWWNAYLEDRSHPDDDHPERGRLIAEIRLQLQRVSDLMSRDEDELQKANSSLFEALERFRGRVSRITDAPKPDIVWDDVAHQKAVVYFSLAAQEYSDLAAGFARIMCADLTAWCGKRNRLGEGSPWYLIADEVDRWIPASFTDFLARGRSSGLRCVAIGQTRASFGERLGANGREIVEGNTGTVFQFAAKGPADAAAAAKYAGIARISDVSLGATTSAAQGSSGQGTMGGHQTTQSVQTHAHDADLFPAWAVQNLPTGTALVITQAGTAIIACPEIDGE
jgi:NAD(P)-dependent dehydrogenase (short-subunit alcohol dehydrogenase family)